MRPEWTKIPLCFWKLISFERFFYPILPELVKEVRMCFLLMSSFLSLCLNNVAKLKIFCQKINRFLQFFRNNNAAKGFSLFYQSRRNIIYLHRRLLAELFQRIFHYQQLMRMPNQGGFN